MKACTVCCGDKTDAADLIGMGSAFVDMREA